MNAIKRNQTVAAGVARRLGFLIPYIISNGSDDGALKVSVKRGQGYSIQHLNHLYSLLLFNNS